MRTLGRCPHFHLSFLGSAALKTGTRTGWALLLLAPALLLVAVLLLWPLKEIVQISLQDRFPSPTSFGVSNYLRFLSEPYYGRVISNTFWLALTVSVLCAVCGYPVAWFLARTRSEWRHIVFLFVLAPLLVSVVVRTIGWTILLGSEGLVNRFLVGVGIADAPLRLVGFWSIVVGMVHVLLPFMVISITSVLGRLDVSYIEAAATLGANRRKAFFNVVLPLSVNGVAAGFVIVFCLTIGSYITPIWLGRGAVPVLSISIYEQMIVLGALPLGSAMSVVLIAAMLVVLLLYGLTISRFVRR